MKRWLAFSLLISIALPHLALAFSSNSFSTTLSAASNQYYTAVDSASLSNLGGAGGTNQYAICFWYKATTTGTSRDILAKVTGATYEYEVFTGGATDYLGVTWSQDGTAANRSQFRTTNAMFTDTTTWHHYCAVVSPATPSAVIYKDGSSQTMTTVLTASTKTSDTSAAFELGAVDSGTPTSFANGKIDDVRIYEGTFSSTNVSDLFNSPCSASFSATLETEWLLENNGNDSGPNGNTLTAHNSPTFSNDVPYTCPVITTPASISDLILFQ